MKNLKYSIPMDAPDGCFSVPIPPSAMVRHVGLDPTGAPCMWVQHFDSREGSRPFKWLMTGEVFGFTDGYTAYQGTFVLGSIVGHLFEIGELEVNVPD